MSTTITSPEVEIVFSALRSPRPAMKKGSDRLEYSVKCLVSETAQGAAEFKQQLQQINRDLVTTQDNNKSKHAIPAGHFAFSARTIKAPEVYDSAGNRLDAANIPMLSKGTTAKIVVTSFKSENGGGINLLGVKLMNVNEYTGTDYTPDQIKAALNS